MERILEEGAREDCFRFGWIPTSVCMYHGKHYCLHACVCACSQKTVVCSNARLQNQKCRLSSAKVSSKMSQRDQKYIVQSHAKATSKQLVKTITHRRHNQNRNANKQRNKTHNVDAVICALSSPRLEVRMMVVTLTSFSR